MSQAHHPGFLYVAYSVRGFDSTLAGRTKGVVLCAYADKAKALEHLHSVRSRYEHCALEQCHLFVERKTGRVHMIKDSCLLGPGVPTDAKAYADLERLILDLRQRLQRLEANLENLAEAAQAMMQS